MRRLPPATLPAVKKSGCRGEEEMKRIVVLIVLMLVLAATCAFAQVEQPVGQVPAIAAASSEQPQDCVQEAVKPQILPVYHSVEDRALTPAEQKYVNSAPDIQGLQAEMSEMLRGMDIDTGKPHPVIHVPANGLFPTEPRARNAEVRRMFGLYQVWTGPHKVTMPVLRGPKGDRGPAGPPGQPGHPGTAGNVVVNNYSYNFAPAMYPSQPILPYQAPTVVSTQLAQVTAVPMPSFDITNINNLQSWIDIMMKQWMDQQQQVGFTADP